MREELLPYNPKLKAIARLSPTKYDGKQRLCSGSALKGSKFKVTTLTGKSPLMSTSSIFTVKKLKLAIEIDGTSHDSEEAQEQDQYRQARLEAIGVRFLRFRDEDVRLRLDEVVRTIECWMPKSLHRRMLTQ